MPKITTFLTFNDQAEAAIELYISIFRNSRILNVARYGEGGPGPKGSVMSATFELEGQEFHALNGGPTFTFSQGISLFVSCETQAEVDDLWEKLLVGGKPLQCGWLQDRFGVSWQVIPNGLGKLLSDPDPARSGRVMKAMMSMQKIDIAALKRAWEG
jgi:predicted 3-demethylubiquinone-9 3-methyltransferase (glyoxalase superfamily)